MANYYTGAMKHSNANFIVMANAEMLRGEVAYALGAHNDILFSHPVYLGAGPASRASLYSRATPNTGRFITSAARRT